MRTSNPTFREKLFVHTNSSEYMTLDGTLNKALILLACVVGTAIFSWGYLSTLSPVVYYGTFIAALLVGLVLAIVTAFKPEWASRTAPAYALAEGIVIGGLSQIMESMYPGIVFEAIGLTFGVLLLMLLVYRAGWIKATRGFRLGIMVATGSIALLYLVSFGLSFFGVNVPYINDSSPFGIIFSLVVVTVAALNFILDFDFIEQASKNRAAKHMEWYGAFGLMVTLIWLYIEILRLLGKLRER